VPFHTSSRAYRIVQNIRALKGLDESMKKFSLLFSKVYGIATLFFSFLCDIIA
jgi:hypothetical protein